MAGYNLKDSEDVEEYLKNLYTEYQFGCLSEKNPEVCHLLGDYYESIKQDYKAALNVYKKNCDDYKYGRSCTKYGGYRAIGNECKQDFETAFKYMQRGCNYNDSRGCLHAGTLAVSKQKAKEPRKDQILLGMEMLTKACDANEEKACFYLSGIFLNGIKDFVEANQKQAYLYSLKCCEFGNPYACANVSIMHKKGDGVQQNDDLAKTFRTRAEELYKELTEFKHQVKFHQGLNP